MNKLIKVVEDFKPIPMGRADGADFRDRFLLEHYKKGTPVIIDLNDNRLGYGSSFLEEAFGGLVRKTEIDFEQFKSLYTIRHKHKFYADIVHEYVKSACSSRNPSHYHTA